MRVPAPAARTTARFVRMGAKPQNAVRTRKRRRRPSDGIFRDAGGTPHFRTAPKLSSDDRVSDPLSLLLGGEEPGQVLERSTSRDDAADVDLAGRQRVEGGARFRGCVM